MYRAKVEQFGNYPCFALDGSRVVRRNPSRVVMVHVVEPQSAPAAGDGEVMWSLGLPRGATLLIQGDECVPYGVAPDNAEVMVPPSPLRVGVAYSVSLDTDVLRKKATRNRTYSGDFCLSTRADGSIHVHDLWASNADVPEGDPCRELYQREHRIRSDAGRTSDPDATPALWQSIERLAKKMPFTPTKVEQALGTPLAIKTQSPYMTQWIGGGRISLGADLHITGSSLALGPSGEFNNRSGLTIELGGACITFEQVRREFGALEVTQAPRGHSANETYVHVALQPWGRISFVFKAGDPDCLSRVGIRPLRAEQGTPGGSTLGGVGVQVRSAWLS